MMMRKRNLPPVLLFIMLVLPALRAGSLEIGVSFDVGNLGFKPDRVSTDTGYSGTDILWGGSIRFAQTLSENVTMEGGLYRDSVLRNSVEVLFYYNLDYLSIGLGTFNGLFNTTGTVLKPGIFTSMQIGVPGLIFVRLGTSSSLGGQLIEIGDYLQERSDVSLGFYVHNAICSLNLQSKRFIEKQAAALEVTDSLVAYSFETDIYQKNLPYHLILRFTYQSLAKKYNDGSGTPPIHTLSSLILGTELDIDVSRSLSILLNLESSLYTFGQDDLSGVSVPITSGYLFRAYSGFTLDLGKLKEKGPGLSP